MGIVLVLTGCGELGVDTLAHDTLQTQAGGQEADADKRECVMPRRASTVVRKVGFVALPDHERGCHSEECLDHGAHKEPEPGLGAHAVADPAEEGATEEGEDRAERLLVGNVEVCVPRAVLPEAGESEAELKGVAGLEAAPDEDGGEADDVAVRVQYMHYDEDDELSNSHKAGHEAVCCEWPCRLVRVYVRHEVRAGEESAPAGVDGLLRHPR